jgi:hypothetical protein
MKATDSTTDQERLPMGAQQNATNFMSENEKHDTPAEYTRIK